MNRSNMMLEDGTRIIGQFESLKPLQNNEYTCYFNNQNHALYLHTYKGQLNKTYQPNGRGQLLQGQLIIYDGEFINGLRDGDGTIFSQNKKVYQGQFSKDFKHGKGRITDIRGHLIEGPFDHDRKHGTFITVEMNPQIISNYQYDILEESQQINDDNACKRPIAQWQVSVASGFGIHISDSVYATLQPSCWLSSSVVDYCVKIFEKQYNFDLCDSVTEASHKRILVLQTDFFQDYAGSIIGSEGCYKNVQQRACEFRRRNDRSMFESYDRILLLINVNRSHFILVVVESDRNSDDKIITLSIKFVDSITTDEQSYVNIQRIILQLIKDDLEDIYHDRIPNDLI